MGSHQLASVVRRTDCTLSKHRVGQASLPAAALLGGSRASGALPSTPGRNPAAAKIGRPTFSSRSDTLARILNSQLIHPI